MLNAEFTATSAFPHPEGSADSALPTKFAPGVHTAQVNGAGATTGVALIEADDAEVPLPSGRLAKTSVSARVGIDAQTLIPGLLIGGSALTNLGVAGALAEPLLKNFSGQQELAANT